MDQSLIQLHCEHNSSKSITIGEAIFDANYLLELAKTSGFYKRTPRKIDICSLLASICAECITGSPSCNELAISIESNNQGCGPSRQAVHQRMGGSLETFVHRLLEDLIARRLKSEHISNADSTSESEPFANYNRVLVQDSTVIKLPGHLFAEFSGVSNGHSSVCNARIQSTYDLITKRLVNFSIDPYSKNDLTAAPELPIETGDLVLRDRGYLVLDEIQRHLDAGADCIYRHKTGILYLDPQTLDPIDLTMRLRQSGHLDINVLLNNKAQTPVRLVAAPVNEETANIRRMKAKKEKRGHNPSQAVLDLMDWTIYITTIALDRADFVKLLTLYGLRWRIEVIFKAWKSYMNFDVLHRVSRCQMLIILKARLLVVTCCTNILYNSLEKTLLRKYQAHISILKLINFVTSIPGNMLRAIYSLSLNDSQADDFHQTILRYCCYDRRKRRNFCQILEEIA